MASSRLSRSFAVVAVTAATLVACGARRDVVRLGAERQERGGDRSCGKIAGKLAPGERASAETTRAEVEALECAARTASHVEPLALAAAPRDPPRGACDSAAQCYDGFQASGDALADLRTLGDRCGRACGLAPLSKAYEVSAADDDAPRVFAIELDAATCYRAFAVGGRGIRVLRAAIADAAGRVVAIDNSRDRAPMLGPRDPFCPSAGGRYRLVVAVERGEGTYAMQVWSGPRSLE